MTFIVGSFMLVFIVGIATVASTPSPYFAAFGLVLVAGMGCGILLGHGGPFLSLILFLIYLGGMLVVFAYSAALAAEPFPELWGSRSALFNMLVCIVLVGTLSSFFWEEWFELSLGVADELEGFFLLRGDIAGVGLMYSSGGGVLIISA